MLPPSSYAPPLSSACIPLTHDVWCGENDPADSYLLASIVRRSAAALLLLILSRWSRPHSFPAHRSLRTHCMHTRNTGREYRDDGALHGLQLLQITDGKRNTAGKRKAQARIVLIVSSTIRARIVDQHDEFDK